MSKRQIQYIPEALHDFLATYNVSDRDKFSVVLVAPTAIAKLEALSALKNAMIHEGYPELILEHDRVMWDGVNITVQANDAND